ncbi:gamma-butyrobetaine hydroxylase-like domain-containing protein [Janthinobacterium sp. B9-8]|uniref:gamma-butyrobetaine hydroxylase-like domain-containing protein n=1 Tax=Janthinobacterium sp. B9-8 TaxID=1236179 RepID=UPI00061CFE86|nr:DUF971 domain-containing protein [Janthinobacterium sp. B9-8]AMC35609.1 1-(5-phosphoribosyl)-5-((5-phosphoribosylamino)methylideneamino)imidazole-4-carboxamide isomerase [Janthinobacterium sp. B9-8]
MSGLSKTTPLPVEIKLHQASKQLEIHFDEGSSFILPCEYLRVYSPSAEVRGHGGGPGTLQVGKADVNIVDIVPVGNYAVKLVFDDCHDSGLYSWDHLYELGRNQAVNWQNYLDKLAEAGASRTL